IQLVGSRRTIRPALGITRERRNGRKAPGRRARRPPHHGISIGSGISFPAQTVIAGGKIRVVFQFYALLQCRLRLQRDQTWHRENEQAHDKGTDFHSIVFGLTGNAPDSSKGTMALIKAISLYMKISLARI